MGMADVQGGGEIGGSRKEKDFTDEEKTFESKLF